VPALTATPDRSAGKKLYNDKTSSAVMVPRFMAAMLVMLRSTALLYPIAATSMGSLAVAAITATAVHAMDASAMIPMWNLETWALFLGFGAVFGRGMLPRLMPQPSAVSS
jgi:hypothetical protein